MDDGIYVSTSDFTLEVRLSNKYAKPSLSILEYFMAPDEDEPPSTPASLERTTVSLLAGVSALTSVEKDQKIAALEKQIAALEKKAVDDAQLQAKNVADDKRLDSLEQKIDMILKAVSPDALPLSPGGAASTAHGRLLSSKDDDAEGECAPDYPTGRVRVCANWNGKPGSCRAGESCVYAHPMGCVKGDL